MIRDIQQIKECPDCASSNIVHNQAREQIICRECGLIFEPLAPTMEEKAHKIAHAPKRKVKAKKAKKRKR